MAQNKIYKTTDYDFAKFKHEVEYWIDKFGLKEIELTIGHDQTDDDARAFACSDTESKTCQIVLQKNWNLIPENEEIERIAFHEVIETLLGDLWFHAMNRFSTELEMESARHAIIRRLENVFWKPDFDSRKKKK